MKRLAGKVAIITGAGSGIGRATAELFAEEGASVVVAEIDMKTGAEAAKAIASKGGHAIFVPTDVGDEASIQMCIKETLQTYHKVTTLVNNAAVFILRGVDATPEEWKHVLEVNVIGPALMAKYAIPEMKKAGGGTIVNLGSISSFIAQPKFVTYNTTKAAILNMTRCMALDHAPDNIRVNSVCPGSVWTPIVEQLTKEAGMNRAQADADVRWGGAHVLKRLANPREVAYPILFLSCDESSFITGTNLMVDGGYTAV